MRIPVPRFLGPLAGFLVFAIVGIAEARPDARWFVTRVELSYGQLTHHNLYRDTYEGPSRTVRVSAVQRSGAPALGGRLFIGPRLEASGFEFFPHVFAGWAETKGFSLSMPGVLDNYTLQLSHHFGTAGIGGELQFLRRVLLLDFGLGYSRSFSKFAAPSIEPKAPSRTLASDGVLFRVGVGARLPIEPVSVGVRAFGEVTVNVLDDALWPVGSPLAYAAIAAFIEFDASSILRRSP